MSISNDLRRAFERASLNREAKSILTARQWKTFQDITRVHDEQIQHEERVYKDEFQTRVEVTRKRLIDQAGQKNKNYNHRRFCNDAFDKDAINRQAVRNVQHAHHRRMSAIDRMERRDIARLIDHCEMKRESSRQFHQDFSRAIDRRSGNERRRNAEPQQQRIQPSKTLSRRREP